MLRENVEAADRFLELADRHPDVTRGMRYRSLRRFGAFLTHYLSALTAGDLAAADVALAQCRQIADASHVRAARFAVELMRAGRALGDGRLDELAAELFGAVPPANGAALPTSGAAPEGRREPLDASARDLETVEAVAWNSFRAAVLGAQGRLDVLSGLAVDEALILRRADSRHGPFIAIDTAHLYALTGRRDRARVLLARISEAALARMPVQYGDLGALTFLAEISVLEGDRARAEQLHDQLLPYVGLNAVCPTFEYRGSVAHYAGSLARMLGRKSEAREHFERAASMHRTLRMPLFLARTEAELSRLDGE